MKTNQKEELIKKLEDASDINKAIISLESSLSILEIIKLAGYLSDEKKKSVYDFFISNNSINSFANLGMYLKNDDDRALFIKCLLEKDETHKAYCIMKYMDNPQRLSDDVIEEVIKYENSDMVIKDFDLLFINMILNKSDYYKLLKYNNKLSTDVIRKIYIKSFNSLDDYYNVMYFLNDKEKKEYTKVFLEEKSDNAIIVNSILKNKDYEKEDYERLLLIVGMFAKADVIYDVLMRENLNKEQEKMLKKALLDTGNVEYIAYYYFFKEIDNFKLLFGSALLFLAYVQMNKEKFKNKKILKDVIDKIKEENNKEFSSKIESKVGVSYTKKPKKSVK